ncbi:MAG: YciI family protein [Woeseia sp.]
MWYAIISTDIENSLAFRVKARAAHIERLNELLDQGRLLLAGPHPAIDSDDPGPAGFSGSLVVVDFPTLEDATDWANADPYVTGGVYANVIVKPFKKVLP